MRKRVRRHKAHDSTFSAAILAMICLVIADKYTRIIYSGILFVGASSTLMRYLY